MSDSRLQRFSTATLALLLLPLLWVETPAQNEPVDLVSMSWHGKNLVLSFSDQVSYEHDLAESDSSLALIFSTPINLKGEAETSHNGLRARFDAENGTFTLQGDQRIGYSTLWGPYSNALVIYTFDWDDLDHGEEQFHLGLIAMERGFPDLAGEYLTTARGVDTGITARRAESVLGVLYERQGSDSLASLYLGDPVDADGWGARASLLRRAGDTAAAASAEKELAESRLNAVPGLADADAADEEVERADSPSSLLSENRGIGLLIVAGILIIVIATMFARRPPEVEAQKRAEGLDHDHHHHHGVAPSAPESDQAESVEKPEQSTPPPSPKEAERIVARSSLDHIYSPSVETKEPAAPQETTTEETVETSTEPPAESIDLPQKEEVDLIPPAPPVTGGPPSSRQADELRAKVESERAETSDKSETVESAPSVEEESEEQTPATSEPTPTPAENPDESTIERARRMGLSRDHVELRERLSGKRDDTGE